MKLTEQIGTNCILQFFNIYWGASFYTGSAFFQRGPGTFTPFAPPLNSALVRDNIDGDKYNSVFLGSMCSVI